MDKAVTSERSDSVRKSDSGNISGFDAIMSENPTLARIVGRKIAAVVMTEGIGPEQQFFLIFDDDTYFELYGGLGTGICLGGGPYPGGLPEVRALSLDSRRILFEATSPEEWMRVQVNK